MGAYSSARGLWREASSGPSSSSLESASPPNVDDAFRRCFGGTGFAVGGCGSGLSPFDGARSGNDILIGASPIVSAIFPVIRSSTVSFPAEISLASTARSPGDRFWVSPGLPLNPSKYPARSLTGLDPCGGALVDLKAVPVTCVDLGCTGPSFAT